MDWSHRAHVVPIIHSKWCGFLLTLSPMSCWGLGARGWAIEGVYYIYSVAWLRSLCSILHLTLHNCGLPFLYWFEPKQIRGAADPDEANKFFWLQRIRNASQQQYEYWQQCYWALQPKGLCSRMGCAAGCAADCAVCTVHNLVEINGHRWKRAHAILVYYLNNLTSTS